MENERKRPTLQTIAGYLKNTFWILLCLQFIPLFLSNFKDIVADAFSPKVHVGCLSIKGEIRDASFYVQKINEFAKDESIEALLVKIDSPGGYTGTSHIIFNELKRFKAQKPVVALIENVGASGGYYIAAAAHKIVASPQSMVGSIGAFVLVPNIKELLTAWKVRFHDIHSGAFKTAGSPVGEMTDESRAYLQNLSDDHYHIFINDIAACRAVDAKNHTEWADGKVFTGRQAFELKLVDRLGSLSDALDELKKVANIHDEIKLVYAKHSTGALQWLLGDDEGGSSVQSFSNTVASSIGSTLANSLTSVSNQV